MRKQFIPFLLVLIAPCLTSLAINDQENTIEIKYRTFGLGLQTPLILEPSEQVTMVMHNQFSAHHSYVGDRWMKFYRYTNPRANESDSNASPTPNSLPQQNSPQENRPLPFAGIRIPNGITEALLVFRKGSNGHEIIAFDDSLSHADTRNIHFYNLCETPLVVRTFNQIKQVGPLQQARWDISPDESNSLIQVAVTDPLTKLVYETRYRLRDGQRIVFLATQQEPTASAEGARFKIESHLQPIHKPEAEIPQ